MCVIRVHQDVMDQLDQPVQKVSLERWLYHQNAKVQKAEKESRVFPVVEDCPDVKDLLDRGDLVDQTDVLD